MPAFLSLHAPTDPSVGADLLIVPVGLPMGDLPARLARVTRGGAAAVARAIDLGDFEAKAGKSLLVHSRDFERFPRVLLLGLGERKSFSAASVRREFSGAARDELFGRIDSVAVFCDAVLGSGAALVESVAAATDGLLEGAYRWTLASETKKRPPGHYIFLSRNAASVSRIEQGIAKGRVLAAGVSLCRDLANEPANRLAPEKFAARARELARSAGLKVNVLGPAQLVREKMSALLAVAAGSARSPRLIVVQHDPGTGGDPVALVGKGLVYDSGGYSLKPQASLAEMKFDKTGGCVVLGVMHAIAQLELPVPVVGVVAAVENLISGEAYRPGDIVGSRSGKTIEVLNTDAEGRLVLADALDYTISKFSPHAVIDVATLTGASYHALGDHACAILGTDEKLTARLLAVGERVGERGWPLPLWEEYLKDVKSPNADVKNTTAWGAGAIAGAAFLRQFVGDVPWAHLDIATVSRHRREPARGATGFGVRLLTETLRTWPRRRARKR